jgi:DNA-directed RNA polymerase-4/5 subunit 2
VLTEFGVCNVWQRLLLNYLTGFSMCRHPSHWGRVCFLSTPDGENCGLVKNLAITGLVSTNISEPVSSNLFDCGLEELVDDSSLRGKYKVFLNGEWVGVCKDSISFVAEVRNKRRRKQLSHEVLY